MEKMLISMYEIVHVPRTLRIGSRKESDAFVDGLSYAASRVGKSLKDFNWYFIAYPENFNSNGRSPHKFRSYKAALDFQKSESRIYAFVEQVPEGVTIEYLNPSKPSTMHLDEFRPREERRTGFPIE